MKNTKRILSLLLAALLALALMLPVAAQAETGGLTGLVQPVVQAGTQSGTDIVIIIDRSGSMKGSKNKPGNDPDNIALSATKKLVDQLVSNVGSGGVNVAVIAYGYGIITQSDGFVDISDTQSRDSLFRIVDSLAEVDPYEDTNTGAAMEAAYAMIEERRLTNPNNKFAVVLLSDGAVDVGDTSKGFIEEFGAEVGATMENRKDPNKRAQNTDWQALRTRLTEDSREAGAQTAETMLNEGIVLHCVGIYDEIEDLGTDMEAWTNTTGGQYITIHNSEIDTVEDEMQKIVTAINPQIGFSGTTIGPNSPGRFTVPVGVVQVNLQITSPEGVAPISDPGIVDITYTDANGQQGRYTVNPSNLRVSTAGYTMIQLTRPVAGDYEIRITNNERYEFDVNIVSIKGLIMTIGTLPDVENGNPITIKLDVTTDGAFYLDQNNPPKITITDGNGNVVLPDADMSLYQDPNTDVYSYIYEFIPSAQGKYIVSAWMEKDGIINESAPRQLTVLPAPIRVRSNLSDIVFTGKPITYYDANGAHPGYTPVVISHTDLMANNFDNRDNRVVTSYRYELTGSNEVTVVDNGTGFEITPVSVTSSPVTLKIYVQYEGMESEPVEASITVQDAQAPATTTELGNKVAGRTLEPISISIIDPEKEAIAVVPATDTDAALTLDDVSILFAEPNAPTEAVKGYSVKVFDANGTEVPDFASLDANNALMIKATAAGSYRIEIHAENWNPDHADAVITLNQEIKDTTMTLAMIAGGILLAIILVIVIIIAATIAGKPSFGKGMLSITLTYDDETYDGSVMLKRYGKKEVKLTTLCSTAGIRVGSTRKILENITVKPRKGKKGKESDTIEIRYNIKGVGKKNIVMRSMDSKSIELDSSGDRIIEFEFDDGKGNY